jgi:hypothetical protein
MLLAPSAEIGHHHRQYQFLSCFLFSYDVVESINSPGDELLSNCPPTCSHLFLFYTRTRRIYPAPLGAGGVGSIPANSDAQKRAFVPPLAI